MSYHLIVSRPFGKYQRGAHIDDPAEIKAAIAEHPHEVVKIYPKAEHVSGDFHRTEDEIAKRDAEVKAALIAKTEVKAKV